MLRQSANQHPALVASLSRRLGPGHRSAWGVLPLQRGNEGHVLSVRAFARSAGGSVADRDRDHQRQLLDAQNRDTGLSQARVTPPPRLVAGHRHSRLTFARRAGRGQLSFVGANAYSSGAPAPGVSVRPAEVAAAGALRLQQLERRLRAIAGPGPRACVGN